MSELEVHTMTQREAERLTERIRITAHNYAEARMNLYQLVQQAKEGNAHAALGYKSWPAYLADVLGEEPMRLARGERQEMVRMLSDEGMSTRAIAPIVGASVGQIHADRQVFSSEQLGYQPEPREVEGLDGRTRTYTPPAPPTVTPEAPKRKPIADMFWNAITTLQDDVERLQKLTNDERFDRNKKKLATNYADDLARLRDSINTLHNTLTQ